MIPTIPQTYLDREDAAAYLKARGLKKMTAQGLADLKYRKRGPRCALVNGRALYTREWLEQWLDAEVARTSAPTRGTDRQLPAP